MNTDPLTVFIYHLDLRPFAPRMPDFDVACATRPFSLLAYDRTLPCEPPPPVVSWAVQDNIDDIGLPNDTHAVFMKIVELGCSVGVHGRTLAHVEKAWSMIMQMCWFAGTA